MTAPNGHTPALPLPYATPVRVLLAVFAAIALVLAGLAGGSVASAATTTQTRTVTLTASDAGWTTTRQPTTAKSNSTYISVTKGADAGYLKFSTASLPDDATITAATLALNVRSTKATSGGVLVHPASSSWASATLTNAKRPAHQDAQLNSSLVKAVAGKTISIPFGSVSSISKTATTSFELRYSQGAVGTLFNLKSSAPTLTISYTVPASAAAPADPEEPATPTTPTTPTVSTSELPFTVPAVGSSSRDVFAHYFPPYPVSFDNADPDSDYYARNYLTVDGENGKHAAYSGLLRDRPEGRSPLSGDWEQKDFTSEIDAAAASGVDGFMVDVLSLSGGNWDRTLGLTEAAAARKDGFSVIPNIDATSNVVSSTPAAIATAIAPMLTSKAAYKLPDGRVLLSSFKAEGKSAAWWKQLISALSAKGISVAFVAVFLDSSEANLREFAPFTYAASNWGKRSPDSVRAATDRTDLAHDLGMKWIEPIAVQDVRHKSGVYAEAGNTETIRATWKRAIDNGADFAQLITWNDYSEATSFAPSMMHGDAFLDLSAYYATWFKTGSAPKLAGDELILTHRSQRASAVAQLAPTTLSATLGGNLTEPRDTVEVVSMLTSAATLTVKVGSASYTISAPAGLSAHTVPLQTGKVSVTATRSGATVASAATSTTVVSTPKVTNLLYWAATSRG
ncbi:endo-1,3-alpha-glucanase family glycosylhydrolase [Microbacterium fluvii]|uniref:Endo-1,3-alpha-glucanase family glycosylhydrolase n=1 Tax=Microbacterium fluvii TaxID=415215 RepID=A0ABW2HGU9_9MICO|nr:endo-1,3-alpha-glucanase family glycosylhydrolase [Microbacterium fluvii]MCU4673942.1 endo-1,3-alpha-glucanase family glycosylhydrolase [Microbacterium fluvii]